MESDLSGLRDKNELYLTGEVGFNARGFHLLEDFNDLATFEEVNRDESR